MLLVKSMSSCILEVHLSNDCNSYKARALLFERDLSPYVRGESRISLSESFSIHLASVAGSLEEYANRGRLCN